MTPTTSFLILLRRYPTDLGGRTKTRLILRKLATAASRRSASRSLPVPGSAAQENHA